MIYNTINWGIYPSTSETYVITKENKNVLNELGFNKQNRLLDNKHVRECKEGWLNEQTTMPPIIVNKRTNNIIDGQHRVMALKDIWNSDEGDGITLEVKIVDIAEEQEQAQIISMNTTSKSWKLEQVVGSWAKTDESYSKLVNWCNLSELTTKVSKNGDNIIYKPKIRYFCNLYDATSWNDIKNHTFKMDEAKLNQATQLREEIVEIIKAFGWNINGVWVQAFIEGWKAYKNISDTNVNKFLNNALRTWNNSKVVQFERARMKEVDKSRDRCKTSWLNFFERCEGSLLKER